MDWLKSLSETLNSHQGLLTIGIFAATLLFGWASGIFRTLMHRPKLEIKLIPGPTFCCTFATEKKHGEFDAHQTAIALYLKITNRGSAPTGIDEIHLGYHWNITPWGGILWLKYGIGWVIPPKFRGV